MKEIFLFFLCWLTVACAEQEGNPYGDLSGKWSVVYYHRSPMTGQVFSFVQGDIVFEFSSNTVKVSFKDDVNFDRIEEGVYDLSFRDGPCDYPDSRSIYFNDLRLGTLSVSREDSLVISEGCVDGSTLALIR